MEIEELIEEIKKTSISKVVNRYILRDDSVCFDNDISLISDLKESLSSHFKIHTKEIEIVGSGKLGFSLSEERLGKEFNKYSDIDLAIVSSQLFDFAWHSLLELDFRYYELNAIERDFMSDSYNLIHKGIISPDKLPNKLDFAKNWWKIFAELSNKKKYEYRKIRGRLFKNWWFAEKYYSIQLEKIKKDK